MAAASGDAIRIDLAVHSLASSGSVDEQVIESETLSSVSATSVTPPQEPTLEEKEQQRAERAIVSLAEAESITIERVDVCPVHNVIPDAMGVSSTPLYLYPLLVLKWLLIIVYVLLPPWPRTVAKKIIFQPPPRGFYYYLMGGPETHRTAFFSAAEAKSATRLSFCLPHLIDPKYRATDVFFHLLRCQAVLLECKQGHIVCLVATCEKTSKKMKPYGYHRSPRLIIFFQPNSSDLGSCMLTDPNLMDMADFLQCDMLAFDYSGFGVSDGEPSEQSIYENARIVYNYAQTGLGYEEKNIILVGFSLGTSAAVHIASQHEEVGGLVLIAPFTSIGRVAMNSPRRQKRCWGDLFTSYDHAPRIRAKTLVCHGSKDILVRPKHGRAMAERIPNCVDFYLAEDATHQGVFCDRRMWERVKDFVNDDLGLRGSWQTTLEQVVKARISKVRECLYRWERLREELTDSTQVSASHPAKVKYIDYRSFKTDTTKSVRTERELPGQTTTAVPAIPSKPPSVISQSCHTAYLSYGDSLIPEAPDASRASCGGAGDTKQA